MIKNRWYAILSSHEVKKGKTTATRRFREDFGRFRLRHYELCGIGGIIFVWYGDGEPDGGPEVFDIITDPVFFYDHMNDWRWLHMRTDCRCSQEWMLHGV